MVAGGRNRRIFNFSLLRQSAAMARRRELSLEERAQLVGLHEAGLSMNDIAKKKKVSRKAVQDAVKRYRETGSVENRSRSGRPKSTTAAEDRLLRRESLADRQKTSPVLATGFRESTGKALHPSTVRRRLLSFGLRGYVAAKKPLIRPDNKKKRLAWARQHVHWTEDQWKKVLWSDESPFQVFNTKGRVFVRRYQHEKYRDECLRKTVKHGGGTLQVWGCLSVDGTGPLFRLTRIMNADYYQEILTEAMLPHLEVMREWQEEDIVFQQDNDPKHTAKSTKQWFAAHGIVPMEWPSQSPDLNPIEEAWNVMERQLLNRRTTTKDQLWAVLQEVWADLTPEKCRELIATMPQRCRDVIKSKGGATKW